MNQDEQRKSYLELGGGAFLERFDYELNQVIDNILDPNTPATKPRKVTLTLTLKPDAERGIASHEVTVKSALQPTNPIIGSTAIIRRNGKTQLVEMVPQIPGQMNTSGAEQRQPDIIELSKYA